MTKFYSANDFIGQTVRAVEKVLNSGALYRYYILNHSKVGHMDNTSLFTRKSFHLVLIVFIIVSAISKVHAGYWEDELRPTLTSGFDETGWYILGGGTAAVLLATTVDDEMRAEYNGHQKISYDTGQIGDFLGKGIIGSGIAILQLFVDEENGWQHMNALITTFFSTFALKGLIGRKRPGSRNRLSMPSAHTSTVFATATSLTYSYGWWAAIPGYALASFTALTRLSEDAHWFSDTVGGAVLGIFWGRAAAKNNIKIQPVVTSQYLGAEWRIDF